MADQLWDDERVYALLDLCDAQGTDAFLQQVIDSMVNNMVAYSIIMAVVDDKLGNARKEVERLREFTDGLVESMTSSGNYGEALKAYAALWAARRA